MLHLIGAGLMFVGYMLSEYHCMRMFGFKHTGAGFLNIGGTERRVRQFTVGSMGLCFFLFLVFQGLLALPADVAPCCYDTWLPAGTWFNRTSPTGVIIPTVLQVAHVNNTAHGGMLLIKMGSYAFECAAGIFLILSHMSIWYFCEERQVLWGESALEMVFDEQAAELAGTGHHGAGHREKLTGYRFGEAF